MIIQVKFTNAIASVQWLPSSISSDSAFTLDDEHLSCRSSPDDSCANAQVGSVLQMLPPMHLIPSSLHLH